MKRSLWLVLAVLLILPVGVMAQATPEAESTRASIRDMFPRASDLGEGWVQANGVIPVPQYFDVLDAPVTYAIYLGPNGSRIFIELGQLDARLSDRGAQWANWQQAQATTAGGYAGVPVSVDQLDATPSGLLPTNTVEGYEYQIVSRGWLLPTAVCTYISNDGIAVLIQVELWSSDTKPLDVARDLVAGIYD